MELYQITQYLPYDLLVQAHDNKKPEPMIGIHQGMAALLRGLTDNVDYYDMNEIKPVLRPLTDIVKVNPKTGKKYFIDIFRQACNTPFSGSNNKFWEHNAEPEVGNIMLYTITNKYNDFSFVFYDNADLLIYREGDSEPGDNFKAYYNELYKYHFDVYGLIGEGGAIDINTIPAKYLK